MHAKIITISTIQENDIVFIIFNKVKQFHNEKKKITAERKLIFSTFQQSNSAKNITQKSMISFAKMSCNNVVCQILPY